MDSALIDRKLKDRAAARWAGVVVELAIGVPLSFVGPVVMTMLIWFAILAGFQTAFPLWQLFGICTLVMVPLAYWTEIRTHGNFLEQAVGGGRALGSNSGRLLFDFASTLGLSSSSMYYTYGSADPAGIVELMLWGPRQVLSAFHNGRLMRRFRGDRAQEIRIIETLLSASKGLPLDALCTQSESRADLIPSLAYLAYYDWIGVSEAGDKAWLLTDARQAL